MNAASERSKGALRLRLREGRAPRTALWTIFWIGLWLVVAGLLAAKLAGETADDFFITFRYGQNLVAGEGFVFNPGERVFGTTAPGWGLLLALGSSLTGVPLAVLATWTTALALVAMAFWLLREGSRRDRFGEAALGGSLLLTSSFLWVHNGSEAFSSLAVLVFAASLSKERPATAGILAGLAVWLRPEAGLGGLLLMALSAYRERSLPWRFGAVFSAVVGSGLLMARLYFGRALPNTLHAKRLQAEWLPEIWPSGTAFWKQGLEWVSAAYAGPWIGVFAIGGALGIVSLLRSGQRPLQLLALNSLALVVAYPLLEVPFYTWYAIPVLMGWSYALAFLAGDLWRLCHRRIPKLWLARAAGLVLWIPVALLVFHVTDRIASGYRGFEAMPQTELYREAGLWLRENTAPDADISYVEVGALAYYSHRPVRDLLGLVSPENLPFVADRNLVGAFKARPSEWLVDHTRLASFMNPIVQDPWFKESYEAVISFEGKLSPSTLTLYRRKSGAGSAGAEKSETLENRAS